jgi:hypothetical protein
MEGGVRELSVFGDVFELELDGEGVEIDGGEEGVVALLPLRV